MGISLNQAHSSAFRSNMDDMHYHRETNRRIHSELSKSEQTRRVDLHFLIPQTRPTLLEHLP